MAKNAQFLQQRQPAVSPQNMGVFIGKSGEERNIPTIHLFLLVARQTDSNIENICLCGDPEFYKTLLAEDNL